MKLRYIPFILAALLLSGCPPFDREPDQTETKIQNLNPAPQLKKIEDKLNETSDALNKDSSDIHKNTDATRNALPTTQRAKVEPNLKAIDQSADDVKKQSETIKTEIKPTVTDAKNKGNELANTASSEHKDSTDWHQKYDDQISSNKQKVQNDLERAAAVFGVLMVVCIFMAVKSSGEPGPITGAVVFAGCGIACLCLREYYYQVLGGGAAAICGYIGYLFWKSHTNNNANVDLVTLINTIKAKMDKVAPELKKEIFGDETSPIGVAYHTLSDSTEKIVSNIRSKIEDK